MASSTPPVLYVVRPRDEPVRASDAERSDDELMLLVRGGRHQAFDTLVSRHQTRMLRVAYRFLRDSHAAADAVQNTFVEVFVGVASYKPQGKLRSYLYRLLLNQCRRVYRRSRVEQRVHSMLPPETMTSDELVARERQHAVECALSRLPPKQRNVLLMRYTAELGYQEIADALDIPLGTVKSRIFEATARLRDLLEEP